MLPSTLDLEPSTLDPRQKDRLPSLVRINIDSFVVLVSGKFPCFAEIDILFILNYKSGTKLAKIYSPGNEMFIPTYI